MKDIWVCQVMDDCVLLVYFVYLCNKFHVLLFEAMTISWRRDNCISFIRHWSVLGTVYIYIYINSVLLYIYSIKLWKIIWQETNFYCKFKILRNFNIYVEFLFNIHFKYLQFFIRILSIVLHSFFFIIQITVSCTQYFIPYFQFIFKSRIISFSIVHQFREHSVYSIGIYSTIQRLSTFILIITLFSYSHQNYVIHQIRI